MREILRECRHEGVRLECLSDSSHEHSLASVRILLKRQLKQLLASDEEHLANVLCMLKVGQTFLEV